MPSTMLSTSCIFSCNYHEEVCVLVPLHRQGKQNLGHLTEVTLLVNNRIKVKTQSDCTTWALPC